MIEFLLAFVIFVAVVAGMAIGVIYGRKPITGSCGGLGRLGVDGACEICGGDLSKCEARAGDGDATDKRRDFYDAA